MKFNFRLLTQSPDELNVQTAKLGDPSSIKTFTDKDVGKPVKMGKSGNFDLCGDGDAIEGFIDNIDQGPTADKMTVGGVARGRAQTRFQVYVKGTAAVLDYVTAGANAAAGTANDPSYGVVAKAASGTTNWRIIAFLSDKGSDSNTLAIVERV